MKKIIAILTLGLVSLLHAEDPLAFRNDSAAVANDISFSHFSVFVDGGEIYPIGEVSDAVKNTLYGGIGIHYAYWDNVDGVVMFQYAYFEPRPDIYYDGVHQFMGRVGVDWRWNMIHPVVIGAGFTCSWTRADAEEIHYQKRGGTLTDNETEFGWYARVSLPVFKYKKYRVGFHVMWEELWTLPERSDMLSAGVTFERSFW